jgi:hypothetical protein
MKNDITLEEAIEIMEDDDVLTQMRENKDFSLYADAIEVLLQISKETFDASLNSFDIAERDARKSKELR